MTGRVLRGDAPTKLSLHGDADRIAELRCVLAYESVVRGKPIGQTCFDIVMAAADEGSYPEEVRARLDELRAEVERRAVEAALGGSGKDES